MTSQGAWICRACWKANRPHDSRCYRCHTARDADEPTISQRRAGEKAAAAASDAGDGLELLVALPAVVFSWFWRILAFGGVLFVGVTLLAVTEPGPGQCLGPVRRAAALLFVMAFLMRWSVGGMRARAPLAFTSAVVESLVIAGFSLYALNALPASVGNAVLGALGDHRRLWPHGPDRIDGPDRDAASTPRAGFLNRDRRRGRPEGRCRAAIGPSRAAAGC